MRAVLLIFLLCLSQLSFAFEPHYLDPTIEQPWKFNSISLPDYILVPLSMPADSYDVDTSYAYSLDPATSAQLTDEINHLKTADEQYSKLGETKPKIIELVYSCVNESVADLVKINYYSIMPFLNLFLIYDTSTNAITSASSCGMNLLSLCNDHYSAAVGSVEESEKAYNGLLSKVSRGYTELVQMGIDSPSYRGLYSTDVAQLNTILNSIDGVQLANGESAVKSSAHLTASSGPAYKSLLSQSSTQTRSLIDGKDSAVSKLLRAYSLEVSIKSGLLNERTSARTSIAERKERISAEYLRINNEYGKLTDADVVYFGISTLETLDSPSTHISKASTDISQHTTEFAEGDRIFDEKAHGYIVESTSRYYKSSTYLDSAENELKSAENIGKLILNSALSSTDAEYQQAVSEVNSFIPKTDAEARQLAVAKELIEKAKPLMSKGATANEKVANLREAYNYLRLARASLSPDAVFRANARDSAFNSLKYLKSVIDRAKNDSIDVSYEENYYNEKSLALNSGNISPEEMVNLSLTCKGLVEQVFARGASQYASLSQRYSAIAPLASYFESLEGKPLKEFAQLSNYLGAGGRFDPYLSLGHYKWISGVITGLELQVQLKSKSLIAQSLRENARYSAYYENSTFYIDSPVTRHIALTTYSTLDLNYTGIVSLNMPFSYNISTSAGAADPKDMQYSFSSGTLFILIPEYKPNRIYSLRFEDSSILTRTISVKQSAELLSPTRLKATLERQFTSAGQPQLSIPSYYDYPYTLYYDNEYIGAFNYDAQIVRHISPGQHNLKIIYIIENPILISADQVSHKGTLTSLTLSTQNTVPFDIDNAQISYDLPVLSPSTVKVSSNTCTISSYTYTALPQFTRLAISVKSLPAKSSCTIDVYASAPLNQDSIQTQIDNLTKDPDANSNPSVSRYITDAQSSLDKGDLTNALKAVDSAKSELAKVKNDAVQSNRTSEEISRLSADISSVLADLSGSKDADVQKQLAKIKSQYDAAQVEPSNAKKLSILQKAKEDLLGLNTIMYNKLSDSNTKLGSLKQRWLSLIDKGYATSLPPDLLAIESALSNISQAPQPTLSLFSQLENASRALAELEQSTKLSEKDAGDWEASLKDKYKAALSALKTAQAQLKKACGSACPEDMISYSESLLSLAPATPSEYASATEKLNTASATILSYIATERAAANSAIGDLKSALAQVSDQRIRDALSKKVHDIESLYNAGSYLQAKEAAIAARASIADAPQQSQNDYTLIIAGIAVILIAYVLLKMRENNSKAQEDISKQIKQLKREK